jgi:membrane-associated phospholipid phosphatase
MNKSVIYYFEILLLLVLTHSLIAQSPYEIKNKSDGAILSCGFGFAIASEILTKSVESLTKVEINDLSKYDINKFDRTAVSNYLPQLGRFSNILLGTCMLSPGVILLDEKMWADKNTILLMHFESMLLTGFITRLIKTTGRIRPIIYNPDVPLKEKLKLNNEARASFPSGHTSMAFASAVLISKVFCDFHPNSKYKPYIWAGSLGTASIVGYLRYASGVHFPTDILTGAALGSAIGFVIPYLHKKKDTNNLSIRPTYHTEQFQLKIQFVF